MAKGYVKIIEEIPVLFEKSSRAKNIGIRINPDIDGSTMDKITTGLSGGKFGISIDQIDFDTISNLEGVNLKTLSVHIGSQITDYQKLLGSYENLIKIADEQNLKNNINIDTLDFGGGFAVLDHSDKEINFDSWKNNCNKILSGKNYNIIFEPGRFIVADSCELISKVLYIKNSGNKKIAIIDCSFSEYIRPALYDIKPPIKVSNKSKDVEIYDIAGGICESTDYFVKDIELPKIKVGDNIVFMNVGAYGSSMSSTYNSRPRPLEVLFNKDEYRVIRSRDTLEDLCKNEIM